MYGGLQTAEQRGRYRRRKTASERRTAGKEQVRLLQLGLCLALFLTVFLGKGVFPQRLQQSGERLLSLLGADTDFRAAFVRLGTSLSEREDVLGEIGDFCIQVFGPEQVRRQSDRRGGGDSLGDELQFLNSSPDQAAMAAHYLRSYSDLPQRAEQRLEPVEEAAVGEEPEAAVPAVGVVVQYVDDGGQPPPEGYTLDRLSLGTLETVTPVLGPLRSEYGYRPHPIDGQYKFHSGVDIGADEGSAVVAFASGTVDYIGESEIYGKYLQIDHGSGITSFYAHCSALEVQKGQTVSAGEEVARAGSTGNATGPHLHFEIQCAGRHVNPAYYIQYKTI